MSSFSIPLLRLINQRLTCSEHRQPADLLRRLGAVQAQEYAMAKWGLGLRLQEATDDGIERAFDDGAILRTHLMRPTWHFVTPEDIRWLLALTGPRLIASSQRRYRELELTDTDFARSYAAVEQALQGGKLLTRNDLRPVLEQAGVALHLQQRLPHILGHLEMEGLICSGPRQGKQHTFMLLEERVPPARKLSREDALAELAMRYFSTRGPATLQDFTWWSGLTAGDARRGLEMVKDRFSQVDRDGKSYWLPEDILDAGKHAQGAYLLPTYDEFTISYLDRRAISGAANREQSLLNPMVLLHGQIVGGWKRTFKKDSVEIEFNFFKPLTKTEFRLVKDAAQRYGDFLGLPIKIVLRD